MLLVDLYSILNNSKLLKTRGIIYAYILLSMPIGLSPKAYEFNIDLFCTLKQFLLSFWRTCLFSQMIADSC